MSDTRIYRVDETETDEQGTTIVDESFLVRAGSPAQAVRHIARRFKAEVASQHDLVELLEAGVKVQTASNGDD